MSEIRGRNGKNPNGRRNSVSPEPIAEVPLMIKPGAQLQAVNTGAPSAPKQMQRTTSVNTGSSKREPRSTAEQIELAVRSWAGPAAPAGKKDPKKPPSARKEKDDDKDDVAKLSISSLELSGDRPTSPKLSARARSDPKERYQFGDELGKGAVGRVVRAIDTQNGKVVAIKQVQKNLLKVEQLPSIQRELDLLQQLDHPNVVKFFEYYDFNNCLYFILDYVEGGSLHNVMKKFGLFPEALLALYIRQVLFGLQYLHEQGVIHRDVKGANILITKDGLVKLVDFGSCSIAAVDINMTMIGTPFWMAPEIISKSVTAPVSDIWSLGCTVIELVSGQPPYWVQGAAVALFRMVEDKHPPIPKNISAELSDFLLGNCFIREVGQRPNAKALLDHPWIVMHQRPELLGVQGLTTHLSAESAARAANGSNGASLSLAFQPPEQPVSHNSTPTSPNRKSKKSGSPTVPPKALTTSAPTIGHSDYENQAEKEKSQLLRSIEELNARLARALQDKEIAEKQLKTTQATLAAARSGFSFRLHALAEELAKYTSDE